MTRIVTLEDRQPLMIDPKKEERPVAVCRCGLSQDWPFCDGSHKAARDEEDGRVYAYTRSEKGGPLEQRIVSDPPDASPRP